MIRALALFLALALPAAAQEPVLRAEIDATEAIPGQAVSLRLSVLVPTFLPDPPVWPSFEAPNLLVRVASTGPVSERVDGATWSGVSRRYLLAPMVPGPVALPAQSVAVTWADPETNAPQQVALPTDAFVVTGIVPAGAEGLDPFIAADALTLEQSVGGSGEGMAPGDSLIRTVTATIEGASPMFLPPLMPNASIDGVRAYPDDQVFEESAERGAVRGTRTERVTFLAEGGGAGAAPAVTLDWFDLRSGTVETAELPAIPISVEGPPAAGPAETPRTWRALALSLLAGLGAVLVLVLGARRLAPPLRRWAGRRRADWLASERRAWRDLRRAVAARDLAAVYPALDRWAARLPGDDPRRDPDLGRTLARLGAARYRDGTGGDAGAVWRALSARLATLRHVARRPPRAAMLPPLNPET